MDPPEGNEEWGKFSLKAENIESYVGTVLYPAFGYIKVGTDMYNVTQ